MSINREEQRNSRKARIRKRLTGTPTRPRLCVFRSLNHVYAQIIDDVNGVTLVSAVSTGKEPLKGSGNLEGAKKIGHMIAERAKAKNIVDVVFDRNGYQYHGRVKALADAAREKGLKF